MKSITIFSGAARLLHHYRSNLAHLLAFKHLIIVFLNDKKTSKKESFTFLDSMKKWSSLLLVQKYYLLDSFVFHDQKYFSNLFGNMVLAFSGLFDRKLFLKNEPVIFLSQNGNYEILQGANS